VKLLASSSISVLPGVPKMIVLLSAPIKSSVIEPLIPVPDTLPSIINHALSFFPIVSWVGSGSDLLLNIVLGVSFNLDRAAASSRFEPRRKSRGGISP
jgi:hypothetical protein